MLKMWLFAVLTPLCAFAQSEQEWMDESISTPHEVQHDSKKVNYRVQGIEISLQENEEEASKENVIKKRQELIQKQRALKKGMKGRLKSEVSATAPQKKSMRTPKKKQASKKAAYNRDMKLNIETNRVPRENLQTQAEEEIASEIEHPDSLVQEPTFLPEAPKQAAAVQEVPVDKKKSKSCHCRARQKIAAEREKRKSQLAQKKKGESATKSSREKEKNDKITYWNDRPIPVEAE